MYQILVYCGTELMKRMKPLFQGQNYKVERALTRKEVSRRLEDERVQLLLMDMDLYASDGVEAIKRLRGISSIPIVVISKKDDEELKIGALNAGADDCVVYPLNPLELLARVKSQLRRYTQFSNVSANIERIYRVNGLVIDDACRKVSVDGREVRLTPIEYKILRLLVQQKGRVLSIEQIYETIWEMKAIGADNTIAVHIRHIREKIEQNPKKPQYLKVVWGTGYKVG